MNVIDKYKEDFLLENFFKNEKYPGWKNIALELMNNKSCIVAGDSCIWIGGIGNFIKIEHSNEFIGCVRYVFLNQEFFNSAFFKSVIESRLEVLNDKLAALQQQIDAVHIILRQP